MSHMGNSRFELRRLTQTEWIIHDLWFPPDDCRRAVACVEEIDQHGVDVVWLRDLGLPPGYDSPAEALAAVARTLTRASKPTPIPHLEHGALRRAG